NNLQQASTCGTQSDKAHVYDSDGSAEVYLSKNCYDNDIFNMFTQEEEYTELLEPIPEPYPVQHNDSNVTSLVSSVEQDGGTVEQHPANVEETPYTDMQQKIEWLQAQLGYLKSKSKDTPCVSNILDHLPQKLKNENVELEFQVQNYEKENAHLKAAYKNLFDSINVTRAQTKLIIDSLQNKLHDTIYENAKLRAQLFDKVSEQKDTTRGTSTNTKFAKMNPFKDSTVDNFVPNKHVKSSVRTKLITVSQPHVITKNDVNSKTNGFFPKDVKSTSKTKRPLPRNNPKNDKILSKSKSSRLSNNLEKIEENHRNL
nr:hypothetical protein [Tanacetum cinerariifolium]